MITLDDVNMTIDVESIFIFESALAHEKKTIGREALCRRYETNLEQFRQNLSHDWFCFLLSYLEYHDPSFQYNPDEKIRGCMLEYDRFWLIQNGSADLVDLQLCWDKAIPCFRARGFLISEVSEAVGYAET